MIASWLKLNHFRNLFWRKSKLNLKDIHGKMYNTVFEVDKDAKISEMQETAIF